MAYVTVCGKSSANSSSASAGSQVLANFGVNGFLNILLYDTSYSVNWLLSLAQEDYGRVVHLSFASLREMPSTSAAFLSRQEPFSCPVLSSSQLTGL